MKLEILRLRSLSWLTRSIFFIAIGIGAQGAAAAVSGTCTDTPSPSFDSVGDFCTATNTAYMESATDTYTFTVDSAGITGIKVEGEQTGFTGGTFQLLASDQSSVGSFTVSNGGVIDALFDISNLGVGTYTFTFLSLAENGSYNLTLTAVPLPAAAWLFGSVLLALGIIGRKRKTAGEAVAATPA